MNTIEVGDVVMVRDAGGKRHLMRATSGVVDGDDFRVVWVAPWNLPSLGVPFPVEAVTPSEAL